MEPGDEPANRRLHFALHRIPRSKSPILALLTSAIVLAACASPLGLTVFGAGAGVGMGTGVEYTLNGIAYKTFAAPMSDVRHATIDGLKRMDIKVVKDEKSDTGWAISALANQREINIELEKLTDKTTRMRVVANDGVIFKDRATEATIIAQTSDVLDRLGNGQRLAGQPK